MKTAIVILNYNGVELLQRFLPTLCRYSNRPDTEIIVADNNSSDNSVEFLSKNHPEIRQIVLEKNWGFAEGYNRALAQVEAEYYVLLNSDVEVTDGWLSIIDYLDANPAIAACQPKIKAWNTKNTFEYAGACGGFIDRYGYPFCRGRMLENIETDTQQYDTPTDTFWATGACLAIRARAFHECGGFDKNFFAHMEEIDLCWRLQLRGKRIACYPQSTVYHIGAKTLQKENPLKTYLNFRNNLLMLYKNLPDNRLRKTFFVRFWLDYVAFLQNLVCGRFDNAKAIVKARCDFKKMKKSYRAERTNIQTNATKNALNGFYNGSIIVDYYLRRKTKFSDLNL